MKSLSKSLGTLFTLLFFVGAIWSAYTIYQLPENLMKYSKTIDLLQLRQMQPLLNQLYLTLGSSFALGLVAIVMLFITRREQGSFGNIQAKAGKKRDAEEKISVKETSSGANAQFHLDGIEELMKSQEDKQAIFNRALSVVCKQLEASQATAYQAKMNGKHRIIELFASYAYHVPDGEKVAYRFGEGLAGQAAKEGKLLNIKSVPEGYIQIISGLGGASPTNLVIVPIRNDEEVVGIVEIASFKEFRPEQEAALQEAFNKLALKLGNSDNVSLAKAKI